MNINTVRKLEKIILYLMIISLPINCLPKEFSIPLIGQNLTHYMLLIGITLLVYEYRKYRFKISKYILVFFFAFTGWRILCLLLGLLNYQYNYLLSLEQIPKLELILNCILKYNFAYSEIFAIKSWLFIGHSKWIVVFGNSIFVISYYVYHLYKDNFNECFNDFRSACTILVVIMGSYSFVELAWLKFSCENAKHFLEIVNPYLYDIGVTNTWWPPLLWNGQLRSIAREPSFFGIISVMVLPFLWSYIFEHKIKFRYVILLLYFVLMIAATNSRTAIVITIGQIALLILSCCIYFNRSYFIKIIYVCMITLTGFLLNFLNFNIINNYCHVNNPHIENRIENYIDNNIESVTKSDSRSNNARLASLIANINVIKEYPVTGVGTGLKDAYIYNYMPEFGKYNSEVILWSNDMLDKGVLKSGFPALNNYAEIAVSNGLTGLIIFLIPVFYIIFNIVKNREHFFCYPYSIVSLISMFGLLVAQFSSAGFLECSGLIWGLLFCNIAYIKSDKFKS